MGDNFHYIHLFTLYFLNNYLYVDTFGYGYRMCEVKSNPFLYGTHRLKKVTLLKSSLLTFNFYWVLKHTMSSLKITQENDSFK